MKKKRPVEERIREKFVVDPVTGCWVWKGAKLNGYGRIWADGKNVLAHRLCYELHTGSKVPEGLCVCHHCDNSLCVNPDHLFLGTHQNNMDDRNRKGRQARQKGENNGRAKLSEELALQILSDPRNQGLIAREYGVSRQLVSRIKRQERWSHLS